LKLVKILQMSLLVQIHYGRTHLELKQSEAGGAPALFTTADAPEVS
jgi:hypothetical protein